MTNRYKVRILLFTWRQQGSNLRPHACDACALPAELCLHCLYYHFFSKIQYSFPLFYGRFLWPYDTELLLFWSHDPQLIVIASTAR